jgi:hypothetical protein
MFHIQQFAVDKATAAIYEGIALQKIESWYARQGYRVYARYNEANGLEQKRGFDLIDTFGKKWEVKADRKALSTGNLFLEHQALEHSQADYYLIFAGLTYIITRQSLVELKNADYSVVNGGDDLRAVGTLVPLSDVRKFADVV